MDSIDKMGEDGTLNTLSKRERLQISRTRESWKGIGIYF